MSKFLLSSASGGGAGGCLGNSNVMVFIGRLMAIELFHLKEGTLFFLNACTPNDHLLHHKRT